LKKIIYLNESDGYAPGSNCRREEVYGRLELLKAFFDGPAFWMIRLRNRTDHDREILTREINSKWGNGHWRFVDEESARAKFKQLCSIPEYATDEENRLKLQGRRREAFLKAQSTGKLKSFPPTPSQEGGL
jgi:hypothetical protein